MTMLVVTTGGTIGALPYPDPQHPPGIVNLPPEGIDYVREALLGQFANVACRVVSMESRDSQHIDKDYLETLLKFVREAPEAEILITHGTDRILQTAEFFYFKAAEDPSLRSKTVLLTGAMVPLTNGPQSDGHKNLEYSLTYLASSLTQAGIFIVLSDFADSEAGRGAWEPRLYAYEPGVYEKIYVPDGRYNRLRRA